jgi:hypothetical protein
MGSAPVADSYFDGHFVIISSAAMLPSVANLPVTMAVTPSPNVEGTAPWYTTLTVGPEPAVSFSSRIVKRIGLLFLSHDPATTAPPTLTRSPFSEASVEMSLTDL